MKPTKLRLRSLKYISLVGVPAQEHATAIIKGADAVATFTVAKVDDELGIVLGWALNCLVDGAQYVDRQADAVSEDDLVRVAADYAATGAMVDEQHDERSGAGQLVFLFPLSSSIAASLGISTTKTGLLCGIRPRPDVLARFKSGELTGFSIAGHGEREPMEKSADDVARLRAQLGEMRTALASKQRNDELLDALVKRNVEWHERMEAERAAHAARGPLFGAVAKSAVAARTRDDVDRDLDALQASVADRRGLDHVATLKFLRESGTPDSARYMALRREYNAIQAQEQAGLAGPAHPTVSYVDKSAAHVALEARWDTLVDRVAKSERIGRGAAIAKVRSTAEGRQLYAAMLDADRAHAVDVSAAGHGLSSIAKATPNIAEQRTDARRRELAALTVPDEDPRVAWERLVARIVAERGVSAAIAAVHAHELDEGRALLARMRATFQRPGDTAR